MNQTFVGAAIATMLTITGMSAHASCADSRLAGSQPAENPPAELLQSLNSANQANWDGPAERKIVGTWHVSYTVEGQPFAQAFIQWHSDRTEWENINLPVLAGTICVGSWKPIDQTHVFRRHIGWLYTNGSLTGYFTETETDEVASDGNSYSGANDQKIFDLKGNKLAEVTGTSTATRIWP